MLTVSLIPVRSVLGLQPHFSLLIIPSATGKLLTKVSAATSKDVDIAVEAARKVSESFVVFHMSFSLSQSLLHRHTRRAGASKFPVFKEVKC